MYLSELSAPTVGTHVKSWWGTAGRVTAVREMPEDERHNWAWYDADQLLVDILWDHGGQDSAPLRQMDMVTVTTPCKPVHAATP